MVWIMAEELWEKQVRAIVEKEDMKSSFGSVPQGEEISEKDALRALLRGYETGRQKSAEEIGCPLQVDVNSEFGRLQTIAEYVGGADKLLEEDKYIEHAVRIYHNLGIMYLTHVQRKLRQYANRGPKYKASLETALTNLGVFKTEP